jgi:AraC-like DNA-binding protein
MATVILTALSVMQAFAQQAVIQSKVDSVEALLPRLQGVEKLGALRRLTILTYDDTVQIRYINRLLDEARAQKNIEAEGDALYRFTNYYATFNDAALFDMIDDAILFLREHKLYEDLFLVYKNRIVHNDQIGKTLTAFRLAEEAYAEAKALQDDKAMAMILRAWALLYRHRAYPEEALPLYKQSIELARRTRQPGCDMNFFISIYDEMAALMAMMERYDESLCYADSMRMELDHYMTISPDINAQADYFSEAYHRAYACIMKKEMEAAWREIKRAEQYFDPNWHETNYGTWLNELYTGYWMALEQYDNALPHIRSLIQYFDDNGMVSISPKMALAEAYAGKKDYRAAVEVYLDVIRTKDSLNTVQLSGQLNELRTIYELDKAQLEAERRMTELRGQRFVIAGLTFACLALAAGVALIAWNRKRIMEKNRGLYLQIKKQYRLEEQLEIERRKNIRTQTEAPANGEDVIFTRLNDMMQERQPYTDSSFTRKEAAEIIGVSEKTLSDSIKKITGMTANEYINDMRIAHAYRLLLLGNTEKLTIEAIAVSSGFKNRDTFYRIFREKFNITPGDFAKTANRNPDN